DFAALALVSSEQSSSTSITEATLTESPDTTTIEPAARNLSTAGDTQIADWLDDSSFFNIILITFGLGLLLSLTPCVLPMLPILLALVVGQQKAPQDGESESDIAKKRFRGLGLTLVYVLGTSIVYT